MFTRSLALFATSLAIALAVVACGAASTPAPAEIQAPPVNAPMPVSTPASPVNTPMPAVTPALPTDTPLPTAEATYAPVTVESCTAFKDEEGEIQTGTASYIYSEPPTRAITLNQHVTEIMLALELQDHMVGTAYIDDEILPQYQSAYQSIPVLAEEYPSREVILAHNPDFIYGGFLSAFGDGAAGSQDTLNELDIGTYLTSAICNVGSADTLDDVYADIRAIGDIFGVPDRADALVQAMSEEVAEAAPRTDSPGDPLRVFIFDSGDDSPYTAVCCSMFTNMLETAGGSNVFDDVDGRWKSVSWEEVIDRDPELIVLTEADWSTSQEKIDLLLGDAALADITAVKEQRFVVLQFSSLVPGIRNAAAIAELAEAVGQ
ncbi:MAG: ABC transporter substrate-binding protein [Chloroflexi bacterium]|nr:ABC transporter substrate-binding protein [Chloroflexota bacterium]